jgi:hypothetical protein
MKNISTYGQKIDALDAFIVTTYHLKVMYRRQLMKYSIFLWVVFMVFFSCNLGNSSGSNSDGNRQIIGQLSDEFLVNKNVRSTKSISSSISQIASFSVITSGLTVQEPEPIEPDGSFEMPLSDDDEADMLLLFTAGETAGVQTRFDNSGFIVLAAEDGGGMSRIPVSNAVLETIDLGSITFDENNGQGVSSLDTSEQADIFNLDFNDLRSYFRYDNVLRNA